MVLISILSETRDGRRGAIEWRTVAVIGGCYAAWASAGLLYRHAPFSAIALFAITIALHSSLQHEAIHRHPTRNPGWNEALVFLPLGLLIPFRIYRELHLTHHADNRLTDPYDDPESYYLALCEYHRLPTALRMLLAWNNTLVVRIVLGPAISATGFLLAQARAALRGDHDARTRRRMARAWGLHIVGLVAVTAILRSGFAMPVRAYLVSAYLGLSLLSVRSFCEHQWAETPDGRTVIVERSLLGLLFLHNNLHLVHHKHPGMPWYALPAAYRARREEWRAINSGYVFSGYGAVMRHFGLRAKEPVAHPMHAAPGRAVQAAANPRGGAAITASIAAKSSFSGRSSA